MLELDAESTPRVTRVSRTLDGTEHGVRWVQPGQLATLALPEPVILVNGVFDILHAGHLQLLWCARSACGPRGTVVVALDSDGMVRRKKGVRRPFLTWAERATQLSWTSYVDYITEIPTDETFIQLYAQLEPDLRVRGEEYKKRHSRVGKTCPTLYVPLLGGFSTSELTRRITGENTGVS